VKKKDGSSFRYNSPVRRSNYNFLKENGISAIARFTGEMGESGSALKKKSLSPTNKGELKNYGINGNVRDTT